MKRPVLTVGVIAAALVGVAVLVKPTAQTGEPSRTKGEPLAAELSPKAKEITAIEISQGTKTLRLSKDAAGWVLPDAGNYRAQTARVNDVLSALASLGKVEAMTSATERLGALDLAWPDERGAAKLVRVLAGEQPVAEVVIGKERFSPDAVFARLLGQDQAWKCTGSFRSTPELVAYIDRQLLGVPTGDIDRFTLGGVEFTRGDGATWSIAEVGAEPTLPPAQRESAQRTIPELASRLEIDDVRAARAHDEVKRVTLVSRSRTIDFDIAKDGNDLWLSASIERTPGQEEPTENAEQERVASLDKASAQWAGFEFKLPSWRATSLSALLFPAPPAAPTDAAGTTPPAPGTTPTIVPPASGR